MEIQLTDDQLDVVQNGGKLRIESANLGRPGRNGVVYLTKGESNPGTRIQTQNRVDSNE